MGDMGEIFKANKEYLKKIRTRREEYFVPKLQEIGAIEKSTAVWQLGDWFLYPTKGFAMHKKTNIKTSLEKFIKKEGIKK